MMFKEKKPSAKPVLSRAGYSKDSGRNVSVKSRWTHRCTEKEKHAKLATITITISLSVCEHVSTQQLAHK